MASAERSDADLYQAKRTPNCQRRKILANFSVCVAVSKRKNKKEYAEECGVSEKYIQIFHKRIIAYLHDNLNKEHKQMKIPLN